MDEKLAVVLAVDEDSDRAFEKHDRCAAWIADQGWLVRKRLIVRGQDAQNSDLIRRTIITTFKSMMSDVLVAESLSELNQQPFDLAELLEYLPTKSAELLTLKEAPKGMTAATRLVTLLNGFGPNDISQVVYAGPKEQRAAAKAHAATLGWDLLVPRSSQFQTQIKSAPDRLLYIPTLSTFNLLSQKRIECARQMAQLLSTRRVFVADVGVDSSAPGALATLLALFDWDTPEPAIPATQPQLATKPRRPRIKQRPDPAELLAEWAARKQGRKSGSITKYVRESGYSSSAFFSLLHSSAATLVAALAARCEQFAREEPNDEDYAAVSQQYKLIPEDVRFLIQWSAESEKRAHSNSLKTIQAEGDAAEG